MRKCRLKTCRVEIPKLKDSSPIERKGFCSFDHATDYGLMKARQKRDRQQKRELRARKEKLKTKSDYIKEAQDAFNAYIRFRDDGRPCISCGRTEQEITAATGYSRGGVFDAGHYISRGAAPEMRFNPYNCHRQCKQCNNQLSGNIVRYRSGLVERYGQSYVFALESSRKVRRFHAAELKRITQIYRKKLKLYKRLRDESAIN